MGYVSNANALPYLIAAYGIGFAVIVGYGYFLVTERARLLRIRQEVKNMHEAEPS